VATHRVQIMLVAEDRQHECFTRRLLAARGYAMRAVRVRLAPRGRGSAEQHVRELFAREAAAFRSKSYQHYKALITITDADNLTVEERRRTLEEQLNPGRGTDEPVIFVIPKRNIETWIHALRGHDANETDKYPRLIFPSACTQEARRMDQWCRAGHHAMLPSMRMACEELKRMPRNK